MIRWLLYWIAFALVFVGGTYYYDCNIKQVCAAPEATVATPVASQIALPLSFLRDQEKPYTSAEFAQFKADILRQGRPDQALEITGLAFSDERNNTNFSLEALRAQEVANLFVDDLVEERVKVNNRRVARDVVPAADIKFVAAEFNWVALIAPMAITSPPPPLVFDYNASAAIVGPGFPAMKAALNTGAADQILEITGRWYDGETESIGLARAKSVQVLLSDLVTPERTVLIAQKAGAAPAAPFEAAMFRWTGDVVAQAPTSGPPNMGTLEVYFDSNSATPNSDAEKIAEIAAFVLSANGRKIMVYGHTDSSGQSGKNAPLGKKRADALGSLLRQAGFTGEIQAQSRSADDPKSDNLSVDGKRLNRRAQAVFIEADG
jgi:outer membrane protein OmpA-like peptidoglycan-associated protein